ncbi:uncharacterized protein LOC120351647 [Nilaparvata lugens]|uniref:uncharacterized protein LOC120351647 n=1 Tax=Nilaparvata lugens TaxID=108931 RepID=UPI00193E7900|nr:uncharacterized protein LOC120351647 [Nilaparvata lugens]
METDMQRVMVTSYLEVSTVDSQTWSGEERGRIDELTRTDWNSTAYCRQAFRCRVAGGPECRGAEQSRELLYAWQGAKDFLSNQIIYFYLLLMQPNAQKQIEDIRHMRSISCALKSTGIKNSRVACHILLLVACIVNILMSMSSKWHDLESRILCLRDLQSLLLILIYFIIMGQDGRVLEKFCDIMDEQFSGRIEIQQFDEINRNFRVANSLNVKKYCRNFLIFLLVRNSAMAFVPMIYSILLVISAVMKDDYEKLNHLPVIINFHYPERHAAGNCNWLSIFSLLISM